MVVYAAKARSAAPAACVPVHVCVCDAYLSAVPSVCTGHVVTLLSASAGTFLLTCTPLAPNAYVYCECFRAKVRS